MHTEEEKTGHTPGPWFAEKPRQHWRVWCEDGSRTGNIVAMVNSIFGHTENEANARLIAAAPDLLEQCTRYVSFIELYRPHAERKSEHYLGMKSAIAKAKGGA